MSEEIKIYQNHIDLSFAKLNRFLFNPAENAIGMKKTLIKYCISKYYDSNDWRWLDQAEKIVDEGVKTIKF